MEPVGREKERREFILEFASYGKEPLYILIAVLLEEALFKNPLDAGQALFELVREGYLTAYLAPKKSGSEYEAIEQIDRDALLRAVQERRDFEEYPRGREYFFRTSKKGLSAIENPLHLISERELLRHEDTGEYLERHLLTTQEGKAVWKHPHYKPPEGWDWQKERQRAN